MEKFFNSFGSYYRESSFDSVVFWLFPAGAIVLTWILAMVFMRVLKRNRQLKTAFAIKRAWILGGLSVAAIIIGITCYWWTANYFDGHPYRFSLLLSLFISMLIPVVTLYRLGQLYTTATLHEIAKQPKTPSQLDHTITSLKRSFRRLKLFFFLPIAGFVMLFPMLNRGTNLISIVLDNTPSQEESLNAAKSALVQTFSQLDDNNEIVVTTFSGKQATKKSYQEIIKTGTYNATVDHSVSFTSKEEAVNYISSLSVTDGNALSPILDVSWQNFLFARQEKANREFENKVLLIITDGVENTATLPAGMFFCNEEEFASYYPPHNCFIIDYYKPQNPENTAMNALFMQNARSCGFDVQEGATQEDYSYTLGQILSGYKKSWDLIYWTMTVFFVMCLIGLLINPSKIA